MFADSEAVEWTSVDEYLTLTHLHSTDTKLQTINVISIHHLNTMTTEASMLRTVVMILANTDADPFW